MRATSLSKSKNALPAKLSIDGHSLNTENSHIVRTIIKTKKEETSLCILIPECFLKSFLELVLCRGRNNLKSKISVSKKKELRG